LPCFETRKKEQKRGENGKMPHFVMHSLRLFVQKRYVFKQNICEFGQKVVPLQSNFENH